MDWLTGQKTKSANQAKDRLKLVLINDRTALSNEELTNLKNELLEVISRHIAIDPDQVQITMSQEGRESRLLADIPLKTAQRRMK
ncbi:MAG: cell division topological specificity factor MinE [Chloroflexi bacterium]|nr:cell division topological specificity factor MinE [Chloroflexota bacterium]